MSFKDSGRIAKARRGKNQTPHKNTHRWESFSSKISKLHSLDPLRKVRRHDLDDEDLSTTTSYFRNGLERWADLNISKGFTSFKREVLPLCESLPQILHFEDRIMDLLASYISLQEKEALEPLLDLLTAFAHDLGVRFEKHYARSLELIIAIASKPQDVEVIEWTFAALAFIFKYLSRLLAPNPIPTFDALAPLLGKTRQPGHIVRFAAEAMSFLIKKTAAPATRDPWLVHIATHAYRELEGLGGTKQQFELYRHGIMTMFAEAAKGPGNTLHSAAPEIFMALVLAMPEWELVAEVEDRGDIGSETLWSDVCCGVLTSIVHHATPETFRPVLEAIVAKALFAAMVDLRTPSNPWRLSIFFRFFGIVCGVRKGARVSDWPALVQALSRMLEVLVVNPETELKSDLPLLDTVDRSLVWKHVIINIAIVWSRAPTDALIPAISGLTKVLTREPLMRWYIPFCGYFSELDPERFQSLFQKHFQRFIVSHWSDRSNEDMLCVLLPRMIASGGLSSKEREGFPIPQSWQDQIASKFERLEITPFPERGAYDKDPETWRDRCLPKYSSLLHVLEVTVAHPATNARIAELLLRKLKLALRPSTFDVNDETTFIVSQGFHAYLKLSKASADLDTGLSPLLRAAAPRFSRLIGFLEAMHDYEQELAGRVPSERDETSDSESGGPDESPLLKALVANLSAPDHQLRLSSLRLLNALAIAHDRHSILANMLDIEQTPFDLQNARNIAVHLRKLAQSYHHLPDGSWLQGAIPSFLFGMLTVPLSPVWDDAIEALKQVAEAKAGEDAIADLAFDWLEAPSSRWSGGQGAPVNMGNRWQPMTDFECLNFNKLLKLSEDMEDVIEDASGLMLRAFQDSQDVAAVRPDTARSRALKVLSAVPALAEKRSRRLVPHLLSWADDDHPGNCGDSEDDGAEEQQEQLFPTTGDWSLVDKKALIGVFSQFINPRVLFQSQNVYEALLKLMANGDVEIQKLALKAILAWKQEGVKPYKETLEQLLDESSFKNELTLLFQGENTIRTEHRAELMPVLLRLLYGRTISKKGAASGRHGLYATRLAVIRSLDVEDVGGFLRIALGPLQDIRVVNASGLPEEVLMREILPLRKQVGLLNMLESIIYELGTSVTPYMEPLVNAVLYCLITACRNLEAQVANLDGNEDAEDKGPSNTSLLRVVRTTALKCLCALFKNSASFHWTPYRDAIVGEVVSPVIERLPLETTQGVSWTWKLLATWSQLPKVAMFLAVDRRVIFSILECLVIDKAKDEVKIFALGIIRSLVQLAQVPATESEFSTLIKSELVDRSIDHALRCISVVLRDQHDEMGRDLLEACVDTVVELAPLVCESENVRALINISTFLLNQPSRKVNPKVKGAILLILERFIVLDDLLNDSANLKEKVYATLASLFAFFKDRENRQSLCRVLLVFAAQEPTVQEVADLCADLNSYVEGKIDEPDYDRRLSAFNAISRPREVPFTLQQWAPLLHNMVFYLRQDEEFGVLCANSADGLCKFVEAASSTIQGEDSGIEPGFADTLSTVVLPAIYSGTRDASETVRREVVRLFGFLAATLRSWPPVADLAPLMDKEDEDGDHAFFSGILTPAVARQLQALQVLEGVNARSELGSKNISQFFIPLLEHFIFGREDGSDDHGLGAQATNTIASLASSLEWQQYRALLRRFLSFVESKPNLLKQIIRLLDRVVDALDEAVKQRRPSSAADGENEGEAMEITQGRLAASLPAEEKFCEEVLTVFLPSLLNYLHEKDESTVSARVPVGIIIVKLLNLLPPHIRDQKLPGVLTDICHILRSKAWESREMARDTLANVACILGPSCFGFVLKELRGALMRGYQLHVLSYTMHTLLLAVIPQFKQGDLDYCVGSIAAIIMDDIFGATGQEKDAEDYVSKMKEVKSSKSQDSMELIAKNASISHLVELVHPLQSLLLERVDLRMARKIDALLSRIASGLIQNPAAESRDTLVFCYEVVQEVYKSQQPQTQHKVDPKMRKYLVQKSTKESGGERSVARKFTYKLVRFAIDLLRTVLRKHDSLRNEANLTGFLPILGDAVVGGEEEVKIATFKLLPVLVKVPFKANGLSNLYKVAAKEAAKVIGTSTTTASEIAQAALKLISVILRDRREVVVKDAAIDVLLGKLKDDLTEPLYRHVTFNFLRSVLDRRIETAAVYDTLDYVGTVMITNDDKDTRDLARGAFFQFLRDYPQKKSRWQKQMAFVVANLQYEREGGRISVMEVVHLLLMKSADDFVQEVAATCFVPLAMALVNDDSERCHLAAGELIKEIFRKAGRENMQNFLKMLRTWLEQGERKVAVLRLALQAFGFYFDAVGAEGVRDKKDVDLVLGKIVSALDEHAEDAELVNTALVTAQTILDKFPAKILARDSKDLWNRVEECLAYPSGPVALTAMKLLGLYLADFAAASMGVSGSTSIVEGEKAAVGSQGLELDGDDISRLLRGCFAILRTEEVDERLAEEAAKMMVFLARYLRVTSAVVSAPDDGSREEEEEEGEEGEEGEDEEDEEDKEDKVEEEESASEDENGTGDREKDLSLGHLLGRLARIIRKEARPKASALVPKLAALAVLEELWGAKDKDKDNKFLDPDDARTIRTVLRPLRHITDPSVRQPFSVDEVFKARHEALRARSQGVMELLQRRLGTAAYSRHLVAAGEDARGRRAQRLGKRRIDAVANPERHAREKRKRFEKKRERRKVKGQEHRDRRKGY